MATIITTKFLIISDTHNFRFGDAEKPAVKGKFTLPTPKTDVLLHCGDLTQVGGTSAYKDVLKMLSNIDAELKLVIAGNHDLDLDEEYVKRHRCGGDDDDEFESTYEIMTGPLAKTAGVTYLEEGLHTFTLKSGAKFIVYATPYQPAFYDWAFPYDRNEDRFNPKEHLLPGTISIAENIVPDFPGVDIMMTHGPPEEILDRTFRQEGVGCQALLRAASRARPLLYCFGHIHEAYGAEIVTWKDEKSSAGPDAIDSKASVPNSYPEVSKVPSNFGKETLMINAAIMTLNNKPKHAPWLIELELPLKK